MIRILIVDDQKSIRERLKEILQSDPGLEIVGTASDGYSAIEKTRRLKPDVILVDLEMPGLNGLGLTRVIQRDFPQIKIIVLSMHDKEEYINMSLQAGAMGYLLKNTPNKELKEAIRFVDRGYAQFGPGLLRKVIPVTTPTPSIAAHSNLKHNLSLKSIAAELLGDTLPSKPTRKSWRRYFPYWLGGNILLWAIAILYLLFKSPTYTSDWTLSLPASNNSTNLSLSDIGSVGSNTDSPYSNDLFDPREDYKFLIAKKDLIQNAARELGMSDSEFGKPDVKIVDNTTLMELSIEGETAQEALAKAIALQNALEQKLQQLRQGQIAQTDSSLQISLDNSERNLAAARKKLNEYKQTALSGYRGKLNDTSSNLETLRRQRAEITAQLQQNRASTERLAGSLGLSTELAKDAFTLHSDSLFQQYLQQYSRISGELINIQARLQPTNPVAIAAQEEQTIALNALKQRGEILLGRPVSNLLLQQLNLRSGDEEDSYRGSLLREIVSLQSETQGLKAQIEELNEQIEGLERRESTLVRQESTLEELEGNVKIAETVFSSNLAKLKLMESNLFDAYPQIQVAIPPSLPDNPSSPKPTLVLLGTMMSSIFLTTGIVSLWLSSRDKSLPIATNNNNNHQAIGTISPSNSILK